MESFSTVFGGICGPKGFVATGIHSGLRKQRLDLALIYSETPCVAAGVYTQNKVKAAPVVLTAKHLKSSVAQAIICNSGNANACTANGMEIAQQMSSLTAAELGLSPENVLVASTGVIGQELDISPIANSMGKLVKSLNKEGSYDCVNAIMTTDLHPKETAVTVKLGGTDVVIGGICKGSGMIEPNMATMLGFITTDVKISAEMLTKALKAVTDKTFNMVSVDGDTSTNDMALILANGLADNPKITKDGDDFDLFVAALMQVCTFLAKGIAGDGEGATKLLECTIKGAKNNGEAKILSKSIVNSSLVKAAMFGEDANWGRVLCALGYADAPLDTSKVDIEFVSPAGSIKVCSGGVAVPFSEELAKKVLAEREIGIAVKVGDGDGKATAWGCDLSYDYVKINGDYRS